MNKSQILKRLYKDYSKKFLNKIILSAFYSILVAGSTSAIAWLLDPAIEKIFIEKDKSLILIIPLMIIKAGIKKIKVSSLSIKIFLIAGSNNQAIPEVLAATIIEKKAANKILFKNFFE